MSKNQLTVLDVSRPDDSAKLLCFPPLFSSHKSGWINLFLAYCQQPAREMPEHYARNHTLAIVDIGCVVNTERRLDGKYKRYKTGCGEILLCPANVSNSGNWDREGRYSILTINFQLLQQVAYESINFEVELVPQFNFFDPLIQQIVFALKADVYSDYPIGCIYGESLSATLAVHLLKYYSTKKPNIKKYEDGLSLAKAQKAIDYIQTHLEHNIRIVDIAEELEMSLYYFINLFKQSMGITPYQYILQQRVEQAKLLLKHQKMTLVEIALACGFANQSHFTKVFRQVTGITPKVYQTAT